MSETTDLVLEGVLCETCGGLIDETPVGHPRRCGECIEFDTDIVLDSLVSGAAPRDQEGGHG